MLLRGALAGALDPVSLEAADLRVQDGHITARGRLSPAAGEEVVEAGGALVLPGLVNAHTHLYSALARGMPAPARPPRTFVEVLEQVWWRLDRALDEGSVYASALVGGIEAALSGTTLLVDHHSSPSFITGSLATVRRALEEVGLRSVLCYEVTDRNGSEGRDAGLAENRAFCAERTALTSGMVGAHASFTLGEDSMGRLGALVRETGRPVHVHVAEDLADVEHCRAAFGEALPQRLARHGLLGPQALLAHCVHLQGAEVDVARAAGAWIAHNPRSNMNNTVGYASSALRAGSGSRQAALGTDGMDEDMLAETRAAFLKMREAGRDDAYGAALGLLAGGHALAGALTGLRLGTLLPGAPADLVVLDYSPPTPLTADNLAGHLLFGLDRSHVRSVMVAGRWIVRDGHLLTVDVRAAFGRARAAAAALWDRMARM